MTKIKKFISKMKLKENKFNTIELILIFIMALTFGLLLGEIIFSSGNKNFSLTKKNNENIEEIENVYNSISEEYINNVSKTKLKDAAIDGMLSLLGDKHSVYYDEKTSENFKDELNGYFHGIGAGVYQKKGQPVTVGEIYKNSPASKAGLKKGDQYLKINNEDVTKLTAEQIKTKIKNQKNNTFTLTIKRKNVQKELKITPGKVEIPSVTSKIITKENQKIGYILISVFASNTDEQFEKELKKLKQQKVNKLIIDLRYNQGGQLDTVINIASPFLTKKQPIIQIQKKDKKEIKYSNKNSQNKFKIAILINESSASASEVLSAALNEQLNATLIGVTTYGKGAVQKTKTLPSGGIIKYTIETWKTSKGKDIDGKGIKPTIEIKQNKKYYKTYKESDDTQLQKAIETIIK